MADTIYVAATNAKNTADLLVTKTKEALTGYPPAPPPDQYLKWNAPGVEDIQPNEEETANKLAEVMNQLQDKNFHQHRHAFRATHIKTQGIVKGTLHVRDDLPKHLQQGMFTTPGKKFDVVARYSNGPGFIQSDKEKAPRGFSMKVFGVEGERLQGEGNMDISTQDWFFNDSPSLELTDIQTALEIMSLRLKYADNPNLLGLKLRTRLDAKKQLAPYKLPNKAMTSHNWYSQAAFRFGEYYGHMGFFPATPIQIADGVFVEKNDSDSALSNWVQDYFHDGEARYDFKIQLGTNPIHHPTEDASVEWSEETAPWQTLATITFPPQNSFGHARRVFWEEDMELGPWRCLEAHRPLGSINRLRQIVYTHSRDKRDKINGAHSRLVQSVDAIPDS